MKFFFVTATIFSVSFFLAPLFSEGVMLENINKKSICEVTMAHDALLPSFVSKNIVIKSGDSIYLDLNIVNRTTYIYKNTKVLYKIIYYDKIANEEKSIRPEGRLIDMFVSSESYDVAPGSTSTVKMNWQSGKNLPNGVYSIEAYVIQNGIHVIQDFARSTSFTHQEFTIESSNNTESNIIIRKDKSYFNDRGIYAQVKMTALPKDGKSETFTIVVESREKNNIPIKYSWRVNPYGKFDEKLSFLSTTGEIILKANSETKIILPIPSNPSNRYQAIFSIDDGKQKQFEIFRWLRYGDVPSLIDTYGIVKDGAFLDQARGEDAFSLKKGEKYIAFACLIGGYSGTPTTLTLKLKDSEGNIILSKVENRDVKTDIASFEYPFEVKSLSKNYSLEITSNANGLIEKALWRNSCGNNDNKECKSIDYINILFVGLAICILIFIICYFIRNRDVFNILSKFRKLRKRINSIFKY